MKEIQQEITPITADDLFIILNNPNAKFDYPIHCHPEYELNLIMYTSGTRVVGESKAEFDGLDLVLTGPYLPHVWKSDSTSNHTITIQFAGDLLLFPMISKKLFMPIKRLLEDSKCGLSFKYQDAERVSPKILALTKLQGFESALAFLDLLNNLACSSYEYISDSFNPDLIVRNAKSRRINKICRYVEDNLREDIKMSNVAELVNMSESAFSHFFKKRTSLSFKSYLVDLRIARACNLLATTSTSVSEICYDCGFNNKSNFFRSFIKKKSMTPLEYRNYISEMVK